MTLPVAGHLSPEDLDDILMGTESAAIRVHLETCRPCQQLAAADLDVVVRLQKLPYEKPSPGFADRVMAKVTVTRPVAVLAPTPRSWARAAALFLVIMGGMGSSVVWSLANQARIDVWRQSLVGGVELWFSTALPLLLSRAAAHPLVEAALGSTGRLVAFGIAAALIYVTGLVALRRLIAIPVSARHAA